MATRRDPEEEGRGPTGDETQLLPRWAVAPSNQEWGPQESNKPRAPRPGSARPGNPNAATAQLHVGEFRRGEGGQPVANFTIDTPQHAVPNASKLTAVMVLTLVAQILMVLAYGSSGEVLADTLTIANVLAFSALAVTIVGIGFDKPQSTFSRTCLVVVGALCAGAVIGDLWALWPLFKPGS